MKNKNNILGSNIKVSVLIVTYGERFKFLKEVLDVCIADNIFEIIIVDNGSTNSKQIQDYINSNNQVKFDYIKLDYNTGSAGGFFNGIKRFSITDSDYLIILDDDNKPEHDFVNKYLLELQRLKKVINYKDILISAYRGNILASKEVFKVYERLDNSFFGFSIFSKSIYRKIIKNFLPIFYKDKEYTNSYIEQRYFPFGGTMLDKSFVKKVGLPDIDYVLYCDDFDYAMRGSIISYRYFLTKAITINDIDVTFKSSFPHFLFADTIKDYQIFMPIKNFIISSKRHEVKNSFIFIFNIIIWFFGIVLLVLFRRRFCLKTKDIKKFLLIFKAIVRGFRGDLSIPPYINLPK